MMAKQSAIAAQVSFAGDLDIWFPHEKKADGTLYMKADSDTRRQLLILCVDSVSLLMTADRPFIPFSCAGHVKKMAGSSRI
jgi:hypothetical protein